MKLEATQIGSLLRVVHLSSRPNLLPQQRVQHLTPQPWLELSQISELPSESQHPYLFLQTSSLASGHQTSRHYKKVRNPRDQHNISLSW